MDKSKYREVGGGLNVARMWFNKDNPLKINDTIEGEYVEKVEGVGSSAVYVLNVAGERVGVWGSTVLDRKFQTVNKGDIVGIEYLGEVKSEKRRGASYKDFWVGVIA